MVLIIHQDTILQIKSFFNLLKSNGYRVYKLKKDFANYDDKFDEIDNIENVPEERFYMYACN